MKKDFFISYNKADRESAVWIAQQLEGAGYSTIIQAADMPPGSNFVLEMHQAATAAARTIAVLSVTQWSWKSCRSIRARSNSSSRIITVTFPNASNSSANCNAAANCANWRALLLLIDSVFLLHSLSVIFRLVL